MGEVDTRSRLEIKEAELQILREAYKKDPTLFDRPTFVEDAKTLENFGIYVKGKESFPIGVVKFLPQDFIVEEVSELGEICTIKRENLLSNETVVSGEPTIYATLVKCSASTLNVVDELVKALSCFPDQIRYAGLKDKAAITAQRVSFRQISLEQLKGVVSPHFFLKDIESGKGVIEKGKLKGNRFTILVRTEKTFVEQGGSIFVAQLEKVKKQGFYNYFYLQRFGTPRLGAHFWGMDLVHGYYRKGLESFITYRSPQEIPYFKNIRKELGRLFGNWQAMLSLLEPFPLIFQNEFKVVRHLQKSPEDFAGAYFQIQDQATMWVYAFSSWLFNLKIASYLKRGVEPPEMLPLLFDSRNDSIPVYKDIMESLGISLADFRNLRRLPFIQPPRRPLATRELVQLEKAEIIEEGIVLQFFLPKGEYATTFLSHLFNIISDRPPIEINEMSVDTKTAIGDGEAASTIAYFESVIHSKSENSFEELA